MVFADRLDENRSLKNPLRKIETRISMTRLLSDEMREALPNMELKYVLTAIISHPRKKDRSKNIYSAIVKRQV